MSAAQLTLLQSKQEHRFHHWRHRQQQAQPQSLPRQQNVATMASSDRGSGSKRPRPATEALDRMLSCNHVPVTLPSSTFRKEVIEEPSPRKRRSRDRPRSRRSRSRRHAKTIAGIPFSFTDDAKTDTSFVAGGRASQFLFPGFSSLWSLQNAPPGSVDGGSRRQKDPNCTAEQGLVLSQETFDALVRGLDVAASAESGSFASNDVTWFGDTMDASLADILTDDCSADVRTTKRRKHLQHQSNSIQKVRNTDQVPAIATPPSTDASATMGRSLIINDCIQPIRSVSSIDDSSSIGDGNSGGILKRSKCFVSGLSRLSDSYNCENPSVGVRLSLSSTSGNSLYKNSTPMCKLNSRLDGTHVEEGSAGMLSQEQQQQQPEKISFDDFGAVFAVA